jgi:23S rRNA pseudouridine1911/1915/1917 synthase
MSRFTLKVSADESGIRLDKFLTAQVPELTRQRVQNLLKSGQVLRGEHPISDCALKIKLGETYHIEIPLPASMDLAAESIPLAIVYEDAHLLVIDKPAGMVVHPAAGVATGTLVNALLHYCGDSLSGIGGVSRPGIVHRLDKDTSGLMLVARSDAAHQGLSAQLQDRTLSRTYHAIVWGGMRPSHGTVNAPVGRSPVNRKKMAVVNGGRNAVTHYTTIRQYMTQPSSHTPAVPFASLVECKLETGRTHQIRVHLSEAGCGLIGDPVYGAATNRRLAGLAQYLLPEQEAILEGFTRQALHAVRIAFRHPITGEMMAFDSSYPPDLQVLADALEGG